MHYRKLGKTEIQVSALGFGCMRLPTLKPGEPAIDREEAIRLIRKGIDSGINYIDTAYPYHAKESEIVVGQALKDGYREKVTLVTKCPVGMPDFTEPVHYDKYLNEQLEKLDVDYLDFYLFHGINGKTFREKVLGLSLIERAQAAKEAGKIKHIGFSFHDKPEVLKEIIDTGHFELMLVQFNIIDQVNEEMLAYAAENGLGVAIMGPVGGGRLAGAPPPESMQHWITEDRDNFVDLALKFVLSNPNVSVALSGMGSKEMLDENLKLVSKENYNLLTSDEKERIQNIAAKFKELSDVVCTGCGYCMPCPNEVNIKQIFDFLIRYQVYGQKEDTKRMYSQFGKVRWLTGKDANACTECEECLEKCPQNIPIIEQLKEAHQILGTE
ncbi:MAG: aldo/keto reductase [Candidatus Heimdallarchaeota archaeon]|nr:MAG: aldo/keto reductase [Candidatus Heimdallarchaeota archaeon]